MDIDIMPLERKYRGLERTLTNLHFKTDKNFSLLLNAYLEYLSYIYQNANLKEKLTNLMTFYSLLRNAGVNCEIIVYDNSHISSFFNSKLEFLGLDIVNQNFESILKESGLKLPEGTLNKNLLCKSPNDFLYIVNSLEKYILPDDKLELYYIYKIITDN